MEISFFQFFAFACTIVGISLFMYVKRAKEVITDSNPVFDQETGIILDLLLELEETCKNDPALMQNPEVRGIVEGIAAARRRAGVPDENQESEQSSKQNP